MIKVIDYEQKIKEERSWLIFFTIMWVITTAGALSLKDQTLMYLSIVETVFAAASGIIITIYKTKI